MGIVGRMMQRPRYSIPTLPTSTLGASGDELPSKQWQAVMELFPDDSAGWRDVYETYFGQFGVGKATFAGRAFRLAQYGWRPDDLRAALLTFGCDLPLPLNDDLLEREAGRAERPMREDEIEASAALVQEVVAYLDNIRFHSSYARDRYMWALSRNRWSHSQLGSLFGLTKQRIQQLLKRIAMEEAPRRGLRR